MAGPDQRTAPTGGVAEKTGRQTQEPSLYRVILHNDDYTTMEFVVEVLMGVFRHPQPEAVRIMLDVHRRGHGVCGTYPFDIANTKAEKVLRLAREREFPLKVTVEPA
jgi:ATP-dependent Clp protease adaptor protein ClpS